MCLISLLPLLLRAPFYDIPLMNDEGIFATIARDILHGGLPYHSLFDVTPPVTYLWYALGFLVFGEAVWVPRLMLAFSICATTTLLYLEARLLFSRATAFRAAFVFAASTAFSQLSVFAIDESFVLLPIAGSFLAFTLAVQRGNPLWLVAAGTFSGIALVTNQSSAVHFLFLILLSQRLMDRKLLSLTVLVAAAGSVLVVLAVPYLATGSFGDLWYGFVEYPLRYGGNNSLAERLHAGSMSLIWFLATAAPLVLLAGVGARNLCRGGLGSISTVIALSWVLASVSALALTGRFHTYYWLSMLPPCALLAGVALSGQGDLPVSRARRLGFTFVFGAALLLSILYNARMYIQPTGEGKLMAWVGAQNQAREAQSRLVAGFIAVDTKPEDTIYSLGRQGELYYYSQRRPASRFFHQWSLVTDEANVRELLRDLERNKPAYIIDTQWPEFLEGITDTYLWQVHSFLENNYDREARIYFDEKVQEAYNLVTGDSHAHKLTFYGDLYRLKAAQ